MKQPNRAQIKEQAKKIMKGNMWNIWKGMLLIMIISSVGGFLIGKIFGQKGNCTASLGEINCSQITPFGGIVTFLCGIIVAVLGIGLVRYLLKLIRKEKYEINDIFNYIKENLWLCVLTSFLVSLYTTLWTILFVIPGIIAAISYSMWIPRLIDGNYSSANEIIKDSKKMMMGHKSDYFVFILSFMGWIMLGAITFGIAYIYVLPYMSISQLLYYEELKKISN